MKKEIASGKEIELNAVITFLRRRGVKGKVEFDLLPEEPADVVYEKDGLSFQVTMADFEGENFERIIRGERRIGYTPKDLPRFVKEYIERPIRRKLRKYGEKASANSKMTFIIYGYLSPFGLEDKENDVRDYLYLWSNKHILEKVGFRDIYLVFQLPHKAKDIKIYPLSVGPAAE